MAFIKKILKEGIVQPISDFIEDSRAVGITLLACTIISMILSNTQFAQSYISFWEKPFHVPEYLHLPHHLLHWINDFLMAIFFFLVGMEIKQELMTGELSTFRKAILPIAAAFGGMLFPAVIFSIINKETPYINGWGIPMATDIAFSLGVASLLGSRVPVSLKVFLMALAIIDDLGAILVIALFYGGTIQWNYLLYGALVCGVLGLLFYFKKLNIFLSIMLGLLLWYCVFNSGIHATIAGVVMAMFIPVGKLEHYMHKIHVPVNFAILPLFALANTAIVIPGNFIANLNTTLSWGVMLGLFLGKPLGIIILSFIAVKLKLGEMPSGTSWGQMAGIGLLAGIGFTMSIFITMLAFDTQEFQDISKIAVLIGSLAAILCGFVVLYFCAERERPPE
ncbi:Na+/H+ antiporter NhaA [Pinibacter aurantiacus]|uniref:Na(+)/H(+) antiporter NhaA n=1 Tax=Pinibacter aurantiacus TaxID=2851599 RepID=A0A9E2S355_9BACT|nr:Na+/H+ antiporter NhaA [Pinibacter aurantiacus]MBV4355748.1 Na+/H+ antiporter NhaA [Pinibacter aurantiacus]